MNPLLATPLATGEGSRGVQDVCLRILDVALALAVLALLAPPLLLCVAMGRLHRSRCCGREGLPFGRYSLVLPRTGMARVLSALGARRWPVVFNVLRGDMAWVGPPPGNHPVRPGLTGPWDLRRRTAQAPQSPERESADYLARRGLAHDVGLLVRCLFVRAMTGAAPALADRVCIGQVVFDNITRAQAMERLGAMLDGDRACQVSFVNPACVNIAARDRNYRRALARAELVLPDGIGIKIAGDILGTPLKQNLNGTDLFPCVCELLAARSARVFFLGGHQEVAQRVAGIVQARWPDIRVVGARDGYFGMADEAAVATQVRRSGADFVFVARGVPMQDVFIDRHLPQLGVKVAMGVGGLFDFVSGRIARAPAWMRDSGLEWVWRLAQEPGRMWRRYLLGNFAFLARVAMQRAGMGRVVAAGTGSRDLHVQTAESQTMAVLLATQAAAADLPVPPGFPAALLPFGPTTFVEQAVAQLAASGVRHVHVLACDRPDLLRGLLGDGGRWGVCLTLHAFADAGAAIAGLGLLAARATDRVVLGLAHCWVDPLSMQRLAQDHMLAEHFDANGEPTWSGWSSVKPWHLYPLSACATMENFEYELRRRSSARLILEPSQCARSSSATELLAAQGRAGGEEMIACMPEPWIRMPWGLLSPMASVHPRASVAGPTCIGPGCVVDAGAQVGPCVVLTRDVCVSGGSRLSDALILPDTFVGAGLDVQTAIVNGNLFHQVATGARLTLRRGDALLTGLCRQKSTRPGFAGRALAAVVLAAGWPWLTINWLWRHLNGCGPLWVRQANACLLVAPGRGAGGLMLRIPQPGLGPLSRVFALCGPVLDLLEGRRCWIGVRPRVRHERHALHPEWRELLAQAPIGVFHAPAWTDAAIGVTEAEAAADLALLAALGLRARWRLVGAIRLKMAFRALLA